MPFQHHGRLDRAPVHDTARQGGAGPRGEGKGRGRKGSLTRVAFPILTQHTGASPSLKAHKLANRGDIPSVFTDALLFCPDYTVRNAETAGLAPERIVDASRRNQLCQTIQRLLLQLTCRAQPF